MKKIKKNKKKKQNSILQDVPIVRYQTDKEHGLSEEQINESVYRILKLKVKLGLI